MRSVLSWVCALLGAGMCGAAARAQLAPTQLYNVVDRPLRVVVAAPAPASSPAAAPTDAQPAAPPNAPAPASLEIELIRPADPGAPGKSMARAPVLEGPVDLSTLFPLLWKRTVYEPLCAQLLLNGTRTGAPLVLQPMVTPSHATAADPRGLSVRFTAPAKPVYAGLRVYADERVEIETTLGQLTIALRPDCAPNTAWHFRRLVEGGLYNGTEFHRVIASTPAGLPFMVQGGDPLGNGTGGPGFSIALEQSALKHAFGVLSMARLMQPDTAGSQFFIALSRGGTASLDGAYASFGQLVAGSDVLRRIAATRVDPSDRPVEPIIINRARLVPAPPIGTGPPPEPEATAERGDR